MLLLYPLHPDSFHLPPTGIFHGIRRAKLNRVGMVQLDELAHVQEIVSQPDDGFPAFLHEAEQRFAPIALIVALLAHPALRVNGQRVFSRAMQDVVYAYTKVMALFIEQVVDHLQDRLGADVRFPARPLIVHTLYQGVDALSCN